MAASYHGGWRERTGARGRAMTTSDTAGPGGRRDGNAGPGGRRDGNAGPGGRREGRPMAILLAPMVKAFVGPHPPVTIRFWDGSTLGPEHAPATLTIHSPRALRRILYAPGELGAARAYVAGELDLEGDVYAALALRDSMARRGQDKAAKVGLSRRGWLHLVRLGDHGDARRPALRGAGGGHHALRASGRPGRPARR